MTDPKETPEWAEAVEAAVTAIVVDGKAIEALTDHATGWAIYVEQFEAKEIDVARFDEKLFESEKRTAGEFVRAALPALRTLIIAECAAKLRAEADRFNPSGKPYDKLAHGLRNAADFLEEGK